MTVTQWWMLRWTLTLTILNIIDVNLSFWPMALTVFGTLWSIDGMAWVGHWLEEWWGDYMRTGTKRGRQ